VIWYPHHLGDYLKKTGHLSLVEEGVYRRLIDWYYIHEKPLPKDDASIARIVRARTPAERSAVRTVVGEFFIEAEDGWHQGRIDKQLAKAEKSRVGEDGKRDTARVRKQRSRERRAQMFQALQSIGLKPHWNTPGQTLFDLCKEHGISEQVTAHVTPPVTRDSHETVPGWNQTPDTINHKETASAVTGVTGRPAQAVSVPSVPTDHARRACREMRDAGLKGADPADPRLLRALHLGVTVPELRLAAAEASARAKPFAYAVQAAISRHQEAATLGDDPARPAMAPPSRDQAFVAALMPSAARKAL
jgi:uncharacterized protein YdaU (DUF1376 family)